jgi:hypothetical protein
MTIHTKRPLAIGKERKEIHVTNVNDNVTVLGIRPVTATRSHHHKRIIKIIWNLSHCAAIATSMDETNCACGRLRDSVARWRHVQIVLTEMHHLDWGARSRTWRYNKGPFEKVRFACQLLLLSEEWKMRIAASMYGALNNTSSITLQAFR